MNEETAWKTGFVALDIETTGLSLRKCSIVEIGALRFYPGSELESFQMLINPGCPIPAEAQAIHGICDAMVQGKPNAEAAIRSLTSFVGEYPLVLHNAPFDLGFLNPILRRLGLCWKSLAVFDTLPLGRAAFPGLKNYSLENLSRFFEFDSGGHHRALADCRYCELLFEKVLQKIDRLHCLEMSVFIKDYSSPLELLRV